MAILSRKLLPLHKIVVRVEVDPYTCSYVDCNSLPLSPLPSPPPPPPPPPLPRVEAPISNPHSSISPLLVGMFCVLAFVFSVVCYLTLSWRHRSYLRNSLRRNLGHMDENETHQEFIDEDRGPEVFYPIWLINYVGLEQSVIDSIDVVKYKKSENLIEGTDCSVCLTEFEDDENLRLLPKCSHAFHLPCIDTWLRSHKTCPLCRAPIVNETNNAQVSSEVSNPNETSSREEETPMENNELRDDQVRENEPNEVQNLEILEKNSQRISGLRVKSDLGDHVAKMGEELQPMRRSISMDLSSASLIYSTFSNVSIAENEGCSMNTKLERGEKVNLEKTEKGHKRSSSSIYKRAMKSSSFGLSSQKRPLFIKRSYSSSGKSSESSSNSRS